MRFCLVILSVIVAVKGLSSSQKDAIVKSAEECQASTGVNTDLLMKVKGGDYSSNDSALKKFAMCMMKKASNMDNNGKILSFKQMIVDNESEAKGMKQAADTCLEKVKTITEDTVLEFCKCFNALQPSHMVIQAVPA